MDCGVYPVTYAYRLFGMPEKIVCTGNLERGVDTDEKITFYYRDKPQIQIRCSMIKMDGGECMNLIGDKGKISNFLTHASGKVSMKQKGHWSKTVFKGDGSYLNEFNCVVSDTRAGRNTSEKVPVTATVDCMRILDECRAQLKLVYPFEHNTEE